MATAPARTLPTRFRLALVIPLIFIAACDVETVRPEQGHLQLYVPEERFREIKPGMAAGEVTKRIGAGREKERGSADVWVFGVWRGDKPSVFRWLFTSSPIRQATILEGRVRFANGRVTKVELDESSAVPLGAHPRVPPPTVQPNST